MLGQYGSGRESDYVVVCEGGQDSLIGRLQNTTAKCKQPALAGDTLYFDSTILQV